MQQLVAYTRVSTEQQGRSGLGLEAQHSTARQFAASRSASIVTEFTKVESGRKYDRPQQAKALALGD